MSDTDHLLDHVQDSTHFEFPGWTCQIPQPFEAQGFTITKFMVLEVVAAVFVAVAFIWLGQRIGKGDQPRGRLVNLLEAILLFVRDEVIRPSMGKHDADKFTPLLWTVFFFILFCNLLGMLPWMGTPTSDINVTGVMALITFATVLLTGVIKMGPVGFVKAQVPHMDLPGGLGLVLKPMLLVIELFGLLVKHCVLAIRLFANMFAGHLMLAVILGFIVQTAGTWSALPVWPASLLGATAMSLLELFVAFLQAYIFTFLSAMFIGMASHAH
ncbi:MAG: F0F1 ATP synthase subunit A [Pirellulales bacterium]|nr:F0F1 ATP synthase subunit A [Pirellulales bacterium]